MQPAVAILSSAPRTNVTRIAIMDTPAGFKPVACCASTFPIYTVAGPAPTMTGNFSYNFTAYSSLQPSTSYATKFPAIVDGPSIWYSPSEYYVVSSPYY